MLPEHDRLVSFGLMAKSKILTKSEAYALADETGVHLSEHGGTGMGVIGALAGIRLRLEGNDGRYRGWYHFGKPGELVTVQHINSHNSVDFVTTIEGQPLKPEENIVIGSFKTKTIRLLNKQVVLACENDMLPSRKYLRYRTITKKEAKTF